MSVHTESGVSSFDFFGSSIVDWEVARSGGRIGSARAGACRSLAVEKKSLEQGVGHRGEVLISFTGGKSCISVDLKLSAVVKSTPQETLRRALAIDGFGRRCSTDLPEHHIKNT